MTVNDYKRLYASIIELAADIEENTYPWEDGATEETLKKYGYLREMIECINDVPKSSFDFAIKQGIKIPNIYDL